MVALRPLPILTQNPRIRNFPAIIGVKVCATDCLRWQKIIGWWARSDLNREPKDYESSALTIELQAHRLFTMGYDAVYSFHLTLCHFLCHFNGLKRGETV